MSAHDSSDELAPTQTEGYNPGAKKTLEELQKADNHDDSLRKWKEDLGLSSAVGPADDPRRVVVLQLALEVADRDDVIMDLSSPSALEHVKTTPITIKEGVEYRLKIKFRVQHEVVSGLKYLHVVKRKGIRVDRTEEMVGSYGPAENPFEKKFLPEDAPSGMLARGHYDVRSKFTDDDNVTHMDWQWSFDIKKDWV